MRLCERIEAAITSSKNAYIKQFSVPVAVQEPVLHRAFERQVAHGVGEQIGPGSVGPRRAEQRFDLGKEAHQVDARQGAHFLIMAVVSIEYRKANDLPQRRPTKSQDRCVGPWPPRGREELSVK